MIKQLIYAIVLFSAISATAQNDKSMNLRIGVNRSHIKNVQGDVKTGFYVGLARKSQKSKLYTLQYEFGFSREGEKNVRAYFDERGENVLRVKTVHLDYFTAEVMNKFYLIPNFNLQIGPSLGLLVSKYGNGENRVTLAAVFGAAYDINSDLSIESRMKVGVSDNAFTPGYIPDTSNYNNMVFQVGLTYKID